MKSGNLFSGIPGQLEAELFQPLWRTDAFRLERIISAGQATPAGEWYDQEEDEFVVLLSGAAGLRVEGETAVRELRPGDWVLLPAHARHRVEWTDPGQKTVWLALHAGAI
jgi:cupin 2 domain-containing protein